jgi:hypothetical protein
MLTPEGIPLIGQPFLNGALLTDIRETVFHMPDALVDGDNGNWQERTLMGAETLTFNFNGPGQAILNDINFNSNTLSYANVAKWIGGSAPGALADTQSFIWRMTDLADAWVTSTSYVINDYVSESGLNYVCLEAHTSGVFATDLAANKWILLEQSGVVIGQLVGSIA